MIKKYRQVSLVYIVQQQYNTHVKVLLYFICLDADRDSLWMQTTKCQMLMDGTDRGETDTRCGRKNKIYSVPIIKLTQTNTHTSM